MRAITIIQPWATLIAFGAKQMETRSWTTHYRGPLAIHAGRTMPPIRRGETLVLGEWSVERDSTRALLLRGPRIHPFRLPLGVVVAVVELFQIRSTTSGEHGPSPAELALGDHGPGRYAWSLSSAVPIKAHVPATGRLGLWRPDAALEAAILDQPGVRQWYS